MAQKINLSDNGWQELKKICNGHTTEYLVRALNAARRVNKQKKITKKAGRDMSHWMAVELVYHQIFLTNLCDDDGLNIWVDSKGTHKIRLPSNISNPEP